MSEEMALTVTKKITLIFTILFAQTLWAKTFHYTAPMVCNACAESIETASRQIRKVKSYEADPEKDTIKISFSDKDEPFSQEELKKIDWEAGYQLKLVDSK